MSRMVVRDDAIVAMGPSCERCNKALAALRFGLPAFPEEIPDIDKKMTPVNLCLPCAAEAVDDLLDLPKLPPVGQRAFALKALD